MRKLFAYIEQRCNEPLLLHHCLSYSKKQHGACVCGICSVYVCVRVRVCMRACVHACMRACVHACVCECLSLLLCRYTDRLVSQQVITHSNIITTVTSGKGTRNVTSTKRRQANQSCMLPYMACTTTHTPLHSCCMVVCASLLYTRMCGRQPCVYDPSSGG